MKRKTSDILWLAFQYAKQDRITLIQAYDNNAAEQAVIDARQDIKDIEALQMKLFGTTRSRLDVAIENAVSVELTPANIKMLLDKFT
jgi:hypothetical protein